jgi:hypothetical protein
MLEVNVSEKELQIYASLKKANEERGRALVPFAPRNQLAVVIACGDPRFFGNLYVHLQSLYSAAHNGCGAVWPISLPGGIAALDQGRRGFIEEHLDSVILAIEELIRLKDVQRNERIDVIGLNHCDCLWRSANGISLLSMCHAVRAGLKTVGQALRGWAVPVCGHHLIWPEKNQRQVTYELDVTGMLFELEKLGPNDFVDERTARAIIGRVN